MTTESHIYIEQLASKGVPADQAKAIVEFAIQLTADRAATKSDLDRMEGRLMARMDVQDARAAMMGTFIKSAAVVGGTVFTISMAVIGYLLQQLINVPH